MSLHYVRSLALFAACIFCAASFALSSSKPERTAGETGKNIHALTNLPSSQLTMVMNYMASSLGVRCDFCHSATDRDMNFPSDDKNEKKKAREMIAMVQEINAKYFNGHPNVSCYTCHRGSNEPVGRIPLPVVLKEGREDENEAVRDSVPPVETILKAYKDALGGADALAKVKSRRMTGSAVSPDGREQPLEVVQQSPDKYVASSGSAETQQFSRGYDGTTAWMLSPRGGRIFEGLESMRMEREAPLFPITRLEQFHITRRMKDTLNGKTAYFLDVAVDSGRVRERYAFDSSSHLLVRRTVSILTPVGVIPERTDYSDYQTVQGVAMPMTIRYASPDSRSDVTRKFQHAEVNVQVDEKKFQAPAVTPKGPNK
jgi:hypothetical protein